MRTFAVFSACTSILALAPIAHAACPDQNAVNAYAADFAAARPSKGFGSGLSLADAECARGKVIQALSPVLGNVVGYKAGFTNEALQKRFQVPAPAYAVMFSKWMVASGAKLPAKFGARPLYEADFIAVAKGPGLADAQTPLA